MCPVSSNDVHWERESMWGVEDQSFFYFFFPNNFASKINNTGTVRVGWEGENQTLGNAFNSPSRRQSCQTWILSWDFHTVRCRRGRAAVASSEPCQREGKEEWEREERKTEGERQRERRRGEREGSGGRERRRRGRGGTIGEKCILNSYFGWKLHSMKIGS